MNQVEYEPEKEHPSKISIMVLLLAAFTFLDYAASETYTPFFQELNFFEGNEQQINMVRKSQVPKQLWIYFELLASRLPKNYKCAFYRKRSQACEDSRYGKKYIMIISR